MRRRVPMTDTLTRAGTLTQKDDALGCALRDLSQAISSLPLPRGVTHFRHHLTISYAAHSEAHFRRAVSTEGYHSDYVWEKGTRWHDGLTRWYLYAHRDTRIGGVELQEMMHYTVALPEGETPYISKEN
jgi:hypothetical protein